jgi:hypothetical protein
MKLGVNAPPFQIAESRGLLRTPPPALRNRICRATPKNSLDRNPPGASPHAGVRCHRGRSGCHMPSRSPPLFPIGRQGNRSENAPWKTEPSTARSPALDSTSAAIIWRRPDSGARAGVDRRGCRFARHVSSDSTNPDRAFRIMNIHRIGL